MTMSDSGSNLLARPHAMHVLMHLRKHFPTPLVGLAGNIKVDQSALERRLHELVVAGMVMMHENARQMLNVSLTPFGRDVADRHAKMAR